MLSPFLCPREWPFDGSKPDFRVVRKAESISKILSAWESLLRNCFGQGVQLDFTHEHFGTLCLDQDFTL